MQSRPLFNILSIQLNKKFLMEKCLYHLISLMQVPGFREHLGDHPQLRDSICSSHSGRGLSGPGGRTSATPHITPHVVSPDGSASPLSTCLLTSKFNVTSGRLL